MPTRYFLTTICVLFSIVTAYTFAGLAQDRRSMPTVANPQSGDEASIKNGKKLYRGMCARCHGRKGEGSERVEGVGDLREFHGGYYFYQAMTVNGTSKGMPAFAGILSNSDVDDIGAYLETLALPTANWAEGR